MGNNLDFTGEYDPIFQMSKADWQKAYDNRPTDEGWFFIEKKDGTKVGNIGHKLVEQAQEIGYAVLSSERRKGYSTEAVKIMVDYLFLSKNIVRVQAHTDVRNVASQKVLEKVGFKREGVVRRYCFARGEWRDYYLYSILREEWKEPRILTKN
jgi:RimJ/RimL family protein N-acetyltransferase